MNKSKILQQPKKFPLPEIKWADPIRKAQHTGATFKSGLSDAEIRQLLLHIARGSEDEMEIAFETIVRRKPAEAVPGLLAIAKGKRVKDDERKVIAILALSEIGGPDAVRGLMNLKWTDEIEDVAICYALGTIGDPGAINFLAKQTVNGFFSAKAYAMVALALIGHPAAIQPLVLESKREFANAAYFDTAENLLQGSSSFWISMAGAVLEAHQLSTWSARNASLMTDPDIPLDVVMKSPGNVRRMWSFHLRLAVLTGLLLENGPDALTACQPKAKATIQQLMIALPMLTLFPPEERWIAALEKSTRARQPSERLLAYEGYIRLSKTSTETRILQGVERGLKDKDKNNRTAVAASIIYQRAEKFYPHAFAFARHRAANIRGSMIWPIIWLAASGHNEARQIMQQYRTDKHHLIRETAIKLWQEAEKLNLPIHPASAKRLCSSCQREVRADAKFCNHCGQPLQTGQRFQASCPRCNLPVRTGAKFCPQCGYRL